MTDSGTLYHDSAKDLRITLVKAAQQWRSTAESHYSNRHNNVAHMDAHRGSLMAYSYAYVLAAVLGQAEEQFGPEVARRLVGIADDLLMNGDSDNLNQDAQPR